MPQISRPLLNNSRRLISDGVSHGGFIDGATRRWVETDIMFGLAGGLAEMQATELAQEDVGMGLVRLSPIEIQPTMAKWGAVGDTKMCRSLYIDLLVAR
jgi:hypothetical protein